MWTTVEAISNYGDCNNVSVTDIAADEWVLELEDLEKNTASIIQMLSKKERSIKGVRHKFKKGDVLYSKLRTYLNKVLVAPQTGYCTTEIIPFSSYCDISTHYLCHVLRSAYFLDYTQQCGYGVKMPRLSTNDACKGMIPLPPLAEQQRIVIEIEKWFAAIDQIEQGKADLQTIIQHTKSKILDLAIHGKLVPQAPNDEPAIELLKRINPDFTPCDNGHYTFKIPNSWTWCKLGDIAQSNIGLTYKPTDITDNGIPVYRSNNIRDRKIDKSDLVRVNAPILEKQFLNIGDLLICARNGSRRLVGKCAIIEELDEVTSFGAFMAVCRSEYNQWIFNLLNTTYFDRYLDDSNSTAINQVTQRMLLALHIPLPPLSEQQRIVQKIEELFSVLDNIQNALEV